MSWQEILGKFGLVTLLAIVAFIGLAGIEPGKPFKWSKARYYALFIGVCIAIIAVIVCPISFEGGPAGA